MSSSNYILLIISAEASSRSLLSFFLASSFDLAPSYLYPTTFLQHHWLLRRPIPPPSKRPVPSHILQRLRRQRLCRLPLLTTRGGRRARCEPRLRKLFDEVSRDIIDQHLRVILLKRSVKLTRLNSYGRKLASFHLSKLARL